MTPTPMTPTPMSAGSWVKLAAAAMAWNSSEFLPPVTGLDLRLGNHYVRMLGLSPKGRHIHYEILRPRRRKNQAPDRHWMPVAQFLREARVCGFFKRMPSGEMAWVEPMELLDATPDEGGHDR